MRKVLFILAQLTDGDADWLAVTGTRQRVGKGAVLIEEGRHPDSMFILLDGLMGVSIAGIGEVARLGSGEVIGEMSFIDSRPPLATVKVLEDSVVLRLPRALLQAKLDGDPPFAARFYKALATFLSDRLRGTVSRLGFGQTGALQDEEMEGELDLALLDSLHLAGARFDTLLKRLMAAG